MIKKILLVCICFGLVVCLMGCKKKENDTSPAEISYAEEFVAGQDSCYMYQMDNNGSITARTEDGYYFRIGSALYYADSELTTVLPLCTITNCKHIGAGKDCESYPGDPGFMPNLQYYNGKLYADSTINLYTFEEYEDEKTHNLYSKFYEFSADMKEKKELDVKIQSIPPVVHRGYAYCYYMESIEEEIEGAVRTVKYAVLSRVNLETGEEERILDRTTQAVKNAAWIGNILAYRNYVYFWTQHEGVYLYSIKDGSIRHIENSENIKFWFMDDKILFKYNTGKDEEETRKVYTAKLDFSNPQYAFSLENGRYEMGSDNLYIYADSRFPSFTGNTDRIIYYYDKNTYECLGEINLGKGTSIERYGFGDEKYYFYIDKTEETSRLMYFEKAKLGTGNVEKKVLVEW